MPKPWLRISRVLLAGLLVLSILICSVSQIFLFSGVVRADDTYTLTMEVDPVASGTTDPAVGVHTYDEGAVVSVNATPVSGYHFVNWTGEVADPNDATTNVTMDGNKTVMANFAIDTYTLTMAVSGSGTTDPTIGDHIYNSGDVVNISATPASGYHFVNWTGEVADPNDATTNVTMDGNKTVTANFAIDTYTLTMEVDPAAGGTTDPTIGDHIYNSGEVVDISATPVSGHHFVNWTGEVADPNDATTNVTMDGNKTVTANFNVDTLAVTTASLPDGTVGTAYSQTLAATGGVLPYTWSIMSGALPPGLSLNATTGAISGTPTTAGTTSFTVMVSDNTTGTATKPLSIKVNAAASTDGGGGGGGGGGATGTTSLTEYVTGEGKFVIDATATSADGKVKIAIPKGTIGKNISGQRLYFISIKEIQPPAEPPTDFKKVCLTYSVGPEGANFDPPIYLTFLYNHSQIPVGFTEKSLVIVTWRDGKWLEFEGCVIDPDKNTITVAINHFSIFTVMASATASNFEILGMNVAPVEIYPLDTVSIDVIVANTGNQPGSYNIVLKINDLLYNTRKVTLDGGESQTISFTVTPDTIGEYTIDVNGVTSKFEVNSPEDKVAEVSMPKSARFIMSDLSVSPDEVYVSEEVAISALVTNIGGSNGTFTVVLKIDDKEKARKEVSLAPGNDERISFNITGNTLGTHTIDVNGHAGQFTVKSAPLSLEPVENLPAKSSTNWSLLVGIFAGLIIIISTLIFLYKKLL